jgi:hypothetical protein
VAWLSRRQALHPERISDPRSIKGLSNPRLDYLLVRYKRIEAMKTGNNTS